jgi:uncharacterized protein
MIDLEERLKEEIIQKLSTLPVVQKVILFGSRARGDAGKRSDIDLAVAAPEIIPKQWLEISNTLEQLDTLLSVDLVLLEEASLSLKEKIFAEGEVLYERR